MGGRWEMIQSLEAQGDRRTSAELPLDLKALQYVVMEHQ